jgi:hypothetical protein
MLFVVNGCLWYWKAMPLRRACPRLARHVLLEGLPLVIKTTASRKLASAQRRQASLCPRSPA